MLSIIAARPHHAVEAHTDEHGDRRSPIDYREDRVAIVELETKANESNRDQQIVGEG